MKTRTATWLALIALIPGLLIAAVAGLFIYMSTTATPLHPDAEKAPSVMRSTPPKQFADAVRHAQELTRAMLTQQNLPGLSVAVGVSGEIVWAEGFGWADLEKQAKVSPDTRFRTVGASIALTSAAAGVLLDKSQLKLDAEIQTYVPAFPKKQWPVTLRQLMGHVAGIKGDHGDEEPLSERCGQTADGLKRFAERPLLFEPGTSYRYSTYGWILVSAAIEAAAGDSFFTFMRTRIFEPLGMDATRPEFAADPNLDRATFYHPRFAGDTKYGPELAREGDYSCFAGAGAFLSTPSDLVRFGMAIDGGKLLQPSTAALLQTPQRLTPGDQIDSGLGWKIETAPLAGAHTRMVTAPGGFALGGASSLLMFPERRIVVAVTSNISFADTKSVALSIAQAFADNR